MRDNQISGVEEGKEENVCLNGNCQRGKRKTRSVVFGNRETIFKGGIINTIKF